MRVITAVRACPVASTADEDEAAHWFCERCHPDGSVAWCGIRCEPDEVEIIDFPEVEDDDCVFCLALQVCPDCKEVVLP